MSAAYILIKTSPALENSVYKAIINKKLPEIKDCHIVFGEYDIVVELASFANVTNIVGNVIRPIFGIKETQTLIVEN